MATHGISMGRKAAITSVVVYFMVIGIQGRPQEALNEDSSESTEWHQPENPPSEKDKWRAFEPSPDVSTTRWWEQKMDDNLWDPKPVPDTQENKGEKMLVKLDVTPKQVDNANLQATIKPVVVTSSVVTVRQDLVETSTPEVVAEFTTLAPKNTTMVTVQPTTVKTAAEPVYSGGYYRKAELNTFVEPDTFYRPADSKSWDMAYSPTYDGVDSNDSKSSSSLKLTDAKSSSQVKTPDSLESQHTETNSGELDEVKTTPKLTTKYEIKTTAPTATTVALNKNVKPQNVSQSAKGKDKLAETSPEESNSIYGKGESIGIPAIGANRPPVDKVAKTTQKPDSKPATQSDFVDWADWDSSLFEGIPDDEEDDMVETKSDNTAKVAKTEDIKQEEPSKSVIQKQEVKVIEPAKVETKVDVKIDVGGKVPAIKNATSSEAEVEETEDFNEDDEDVDDDYYDEWEDDWDEDVKLPTEVKKPTSDVSSTAAPVKTKKVKKVTKIKPEQVPVDAVAEQAGQLVTKVDQTHYSKGDIYDFPNHKPSVKKDLGHTASSEPANNLANDEPVLKQKEIQSAPTKMVIDSPDKKDVIKIKGNKSKDSEKTKADASKDAEMFDIDDGFTAERSKNIDISGKVIPIPVPDKVNNSLKSDNILEDNQPKDISDTHLLKDTPPMNKVTLDSADQGLVLKKEPSVTFHGSQLNTESDASTSPNPPPPGLATDMGSLAGKGVNTTPGPSSQKKKTSEESVDEYKVSYPIEFCKVDVECRAGRMCIKGVCKCVTLAMCAGHHKPICGSDGLQYPSHCEMHRTACINRVHIRVDRKGICFHKQLKGQIASKEKGWMLEERTTPAPQSVHIPSQEIYNFPEDIKKGPETSDVKKGQMVGDSGSVVNKAQASGDVDPDIKKDQVVSDGSETKKPAPMKKDCTWEEMVQFKEALLMYYCQKFVEPNCKVEVKTDRDYLSMLMFSYYDQNFDYFLTAQELDDKEREEHFAENMIVSCHLHDFIKYADTIDTNGKLTVTELTQAFELTVPTAKPLQSKVEVISTLASAGNGLELKCGIEGASNIIWKRYAAQLTDDKHGRQLMIFDDGALFFSKVALHHVGNYSCMDADDENNVQVHRLRVQTLPVLTVNPATQVHMTGSDVELKCHAEGVPKPTVTWKQAGEVVNTSAHVTQYFGGGHIVIHNAQMGTDSGTFTCSAHNQAGTSEKSVSVSVVPPTDQSYKSNMKEAGTFVVFNSQGVQAYDPMHCLLRHKVKGDFGNFKFIPDVLDGPLTLCHSGQDCEWGDAVRAGPEYIYASQPDQNRVVLIDSSWIPIQVIDTDKKPTKLWYVKHLDQVWVLCENTDDVQGGKTIVVIRDAAQHIQHRAVHTRPVGNHFDTVQDLFIARPNDLEHEFDFGYVTHRNQNGLFKLNLEDMSYTKSIDLSSYGCVPTFIDFVPIGGHVLVQCISSADHHTLQLTLDYLTDTVISTVSLPGKPMTSPDSRHLVTVDESSGKVTVSSISDEGVMESTYEVTVSARISDVNFIPANTHHGYDLVLTSADDDDVILMNLVTGKVEKITGTQFTDPTAPRRPSSVHRHIVPSGTMSNYLMTPSRSTLAILDAKFKIVDCEFTDTVGSSVMLYVPSSKTS